jgi:hypothetical protein
VFSLVSKKQTQTRSNLLGRGFGWEGKGWVVSRDGWMERKKLIVVKS